MSEDLGQERIFSLEKRLIELSKEVESLRKQSLDAKQRATIIEAVVDRVTMDIIAEIKEAEYLTLVAYVAAKTLFQAVCSNKAALDLLGLAQKADEAARIVYELAVKAGKTHIDDNQKIKEILLRNGSGKTA